MYCKNCGSELKEGQKFCPKCGTPVTGTPSTGTPGKAVKADTGAPAAGPKPPKKRNTGLIIAVVAAVVVLLIAVIAIAVVRSRNVGDETEETKEQVEEEALPEETYPAAGEDRADDADVAEGADETDGTGEAAVPEASEPEEKVTVSNLTVTEFSYSYSDLNGDATTGQMATGTIKNDYDEAYTVRITYEFEGTYYDNYGDKNTMYGSEYFDYNVPARSTYSIYTALTTDQEYGYSSSGNQIEYTEYTGNYDVTYDLYAGYDDVLLPADAISNIEYSVVGNGEYFVLDLTLPNTTEDRWSRCGADGVILYKGQYYNTFSVAASYVKPGEDAVLESNVYVGYNAETMSGDISFIPTEVYYDIDSDYANDSDNAYRGGFEDESQ